MSSLPWQARFYIFLLTALAAIAVYFSILTIGLDPSTWFSILVISVGITILDAFPIQPVDRFGEQIEVTLSNSVKFASVLLFPTMPVVILGAFVGTIFGEIIVKRAWYKKLFNVSVLTVTWAVTWLVYIKMYQSNADYFGSFENVFALSAAAFSDFAVNSVLVSLVISFAMRMPFGYVWSRNSLPTIWHELSVIVLGAFLAVLWRYNPLSATLAVLPWFVVRHSLNIANQLQAQTSEALHALVRVIDERDHHTFNHSDQVSENARLIAEVLRLSPGQIEIIARAALLHDLGKVGMADDILFNPKSLNQNERKRAQEHAEAGALLLSKFPLFQKGSLLVRYHHERYDGKGYPDGLAGEQIPIGSRIICVADSYEAMTENRPYRAALTQEQAIEQLQAGRGTQFDPIVVDAFVQVLKSKKQ